ncbi:MAG TPA: hypothetical protein VF502_12780 [Stellaceae bacterium]
MPGKDRTGVLRGAMGTAAVAAIGLALAACSGAKTTVENSAAQPVKVAAITLQEARPTVDCPPEVVEQLREKLTAKLYKPGGFGKGNNLKLTYRVVEFNGGDGSSRWSFNNVSGKGGALTVEAIYTDRRGKEVAKISSAGTVGSSLMGGSIDKAIDKVTDEVADYTAKNFK